MNYYTSDLHFSHENIIKVCNRPYANVEEMNQVLKDNWNARVKPEDHVYVLGDICMASKLFVEHVESLNGFKHIIRGNHDPKNITSVKIKNTYFTDLIHTVHDGDAKIVLCHYPIYEWNGYYHGAYHFYGHLHGTRPSFHERAFEVGVDVQNYEPKTFKEIISKP